MSFELSGTLYEIGETQKISDKFSKREFIIEKKENTGNFEFVDHIKFQLTNDKCDLIDKFNTGDELNISFNIRGRKWEKNDKVSYFTNLEAWKIEKAGEGMPPAPPAPDEEIPLPEAPDDLPF